MRIGNNISREDKMNYDTNSFKVIETFGYNGAAMVETLHALELEIFTPYALKGLLIPKKPLIIFSRLLKVTANTQFKEANWDFQNQILKEYDDKATQ